MAQIATERSEPVAAVVANPAPLGLCGFALTTFVLSSINAGWFSAGATTIIVGLALFYGGIAQLLAGMWEFKSGNTFGATAFTSYGAFWLSFAAIFIPGFNIAGSLGTSLHPAVGLYLLGWTIFTLLMFFGTLRSNIALMTVFALLFLTFGALTIGELGPSTFMHQFGGYLGVLTAIAAWYTALAGLLSSGKSMFTLPVGPRS
ncbi:MAG TPA: acetate uptake transporter [Ktedonobacteraceae bacterium]|nr:acetate uptake transporter [Ktedonobacteraceae bacterium]